MFKYSNCNILCVMEMVGPSSIVLVWCGFLLQCPYLAISYSIWQQVCIIRQDDNRRTNHKQLSAI